MLHFEAILLFSVLFSFSFYLFMSRFHLSPLIVTYVSLWAYLLTKIPKYILISWIWHIGELTHPTLMSSLTDPTSNYLLNIACVDL